MGVTHAGISVQCICGTRGSAEGNKAMYMYMCINMHMIKVETLEATCTCTSTESL